MLSFCLIAAWLILLPDEYQQLGRHVRGGVLYISNFVLRHEAGYFDTAAEHKPLLHLWSLAIEEQFYIVWPLAVVIAYRRRLRLFDLVAALLIASFVYNVVRVTRNPPATFFLPGTRVWELMIGALLAHVAQFGWTGFGRRVGELKWKLPPDARAVIGLAAIAIPAFVLDRTTLYPGWWAAAPTLGTALLIAAGPTAWINRRLLAHRAMVFVGLISYPLYLWHWPLLSLARIAEGHTPPVIECLALVGVAVILAILTYQFVERPIRSGAMSRVRVAIILAAVSFGLGAIGQIVAQGWVLPYASQFAGIDQAVAAATEWDYPGTDAEPLTFDGRRIWKRAGSGGAVLFLGDSEIEQYAPRIQYLLASAPTKYKTALFLTGGGCPPIPAVSEPRHPHCNGLTDAALSFVDKNDIDTVVIAAQWWGYFASTDYRVGDLPLADPAAAEKAFSSLGDFITRLVAAKRRVFIVLNNPIATELDPRRRIERSFLSFGIRPGGISRAILEKDYGETSRRLRATSVAAGATVIDPLPALCDPDGLCPATDKDGIPIYKDANHLRPSFVRAHVEYLDQALRNGG